MKAGTWLCPHCYEEENPDEVRTPPTGGSDAVHACIPFHLGYRNAALFMS